MSIEESASELRETGAKVVQDIGGMVQQINTDLDAIAAKLQQSQTFAEDSTNTAATVLGEGHPGTGEIVGAAANVVEQVVSMQGLVSQFSLEATTLTERAGALSQKFEEIANRLMG